jgi:S1-C subfamily serine protease
MSDAAILRCHSGHATRRGDEGPRAYTAPRAFSLHTRDAGKMPAVRSTTFVTMALCAAAFAQSPATRPAAFEGALAQQSMVRRAVAQVAASVVTIETVGGISPQGPSNAGRATTRPEPGRGAPRPGREPRRAPPPNAGAAFQVAEGPTTGLVFSADGLILTSSFNFARDPAVITVKLADGTRRSAKLLARDEIRRLAILKIDAAGLSVPTWADEKQVRVGQWTVALGRGFGGAGVSVSVGMISGLERMAGNAIQTDAKLSPANYGGPLIDLEGRVIGLIVPMSYTPGDLAGAELYDSGIGFAVPAWQAEPAGMALAKGTSIRRGLLGIRVDMSGQKALRLVSVADPSLAKTAGLTAGDELVAIDDRPLNGWADLQHRLAFRAEGEAVALTIRRAGQSIQTDAVLAPPEALGPFPETQPTPPPPAR